MWKELFEVKEHFRMKRTNDKKAESLKLRRSEKGRAGCGRGGREQLSRRGLKPLEGTGKELGKDWESWGRAL